MNTKEKILNSALKLFAKNGIERTSTAEITKDVGISSGALFVHFNTKQDLIDELYLNIKEKSFGKFNSLLDTKKSAKRNIRLLSKVMIKYFLDNFDEFMFLDIIENDPQVSEKTMQKGLEAYKDIMISTQEWIDDGVLKQIDSILIQGIIWGMIRSCVRMLHMQKRKTIPKEIIEMIWDGVKR